MIQIDNRRPRDIVKRGDAFPGGVRPLITRGFGIDVREQHLLLFNLDFFAQVIQVRQVD